MVIVLACCPCRWLDNNTVDDGRVDDVLLVLMPMVENNFNNERVQSTNYGS